MIVVTFFVETACNRRVKSRWIGIVIGGARNVVASCGVACALNSAITGIAFIASVVIVAVVVVAGGCAFRNVLTLLFWDVASMYLQIRVSSSSRVCGVCGAYEGCVCVCFMPRSSNKINNAHKHTSTSTFG